MHIEYLFPFIFGVLFVILGCWKTVPKSSYPIKKFAHVFSHPASADLNPCPFVLVVVSCCCCSSAYCCPVEGKVFLSAGGVPGLEPVFVTLAVICCSLAGIWCLAQTCEGATAGEILHWKSHRTFPHYSSERRCNPSFEILHWNETVAGTAPSPAPAEGERDKWLLRYVQEWCAVMYSVCVFVCMYVSWSPTSRLLFGSDMHFACGSKQNTLSFHSAEIKSTSDLCC